MKKLFYLSLVVLLLGAMSFTTTEPLPKAGDSLTKKKERFEELRAKIRVEVSKLYTQQSHLTKSLKISVVKTLPLSEATEFRALYAELMSTECCTSWHPIDETSGMCERTCMGSNGPWPWTETADCCNAPEHVNICGE